MSESQKETYKKWKDLVNMSASELKRFMDSEEGKKAGLSRKEAKELGIHYGRESARWILKMKNTPVSEWTPTMWQWANRQISFNSRMRGNKGKLYDDKGRKTRKHLSLLIWGHNPEKYQEGGSIKNKIIFPNTNSAYDKQAQKFIANFLKRNKVKDLVKYADENANYEIYVVYDKSYPNESKIYITNSIEKAYNSSLNLDVRELNIVKAKKDYGVLIYDYYNGDLFGNYTGEKYDEKGNLKKEVKENAIIDIKNHFNRNWYNNGGEILLAPNGKPSNLTAEQYRLVRTSEFKAWFGDWLNSPETASKVVDDNGEPLVVYHGTNEDFTVFNKEKQNTKTGFGDFGAGFYFTASLNTAKYYTLKSEQNRKILSVFLNIKNPFIIELNWEKLSESSKSNYKNLKGLFDWQKDIIKNGLQNDYRPSKAITKGFGDYEFQDLLIRNAYDGVFVNRINIFENPDVNNENQILYLHEIVVFESTQIKLADGTNTTFDANNPDIRYELGGQIRKHYNKKKNQGFKEIEYEKLIKYGLKYDENFIDKLNSNEKTIWLKLQDLDFENLPISLPIVNIPIEEIIFSQSDVGIQVIENSKHKKGIPICVKKDGKIYIISGNHRLFYQLIKLKKNEIECYLKDFDSNNPNIRFNDGGEITLTSEQVENKLGRKLHWWNDDAVSINGIEYKKVFLKDEYKRI